MDQLVRINFILGFVLVALYFATIMFITSRMKNLHYETWDKQLGRFSLFLNNSIGNGFQFIRYFIFTNRYKELNDETLNKTAIAVRIVFIVFFLNFGWGFYLMAHQHH